MTTLTPTGPRPLRQRALPYGSGEFLSDFLVGDMGTAGLLIVSQISQVDQQRQHIIPVPEGGQCMETILQ